MNWTKIKKLFRNSLTVAWAHFMTVVGVVLTILTDLDGNGDFMLLVKSFLTPERAPIALAVIGIVTYLARIRTAKKVQ